MNQEEAKKKKEYHNKRYQFYKGKEDEAKRKENMIGFKLSKDR